MSTAAFHPEFRPVAPATRIVRQSPSPSPSPSVATAPRAGDLRLTRRGRMVVVITGLMAALMLAVVMGAGSTASPDAGVAPHTEVITVGSGDTLWGIASDRAADGDTQAVITMIQRLNALDSAELQAGQRLRVPVIE